MPQLLRFGRRLAIPSTRQIRHELLVMIDQEVQREALKHGVVEERTDPPLADIRSKAIPSNP